MNGRSISGDALPDFPLGNELAESRSDEFTFLLTSNLFPKHGN